MPSTRTGIYYKLCGARITRGAAWGLLAFGVLMIIGGVSCIVVGAVLFDDSSYCWDNNIDAGNVCLQLNLLVPGVINTIIGIGLVVTMTIAIRSKPEVTGTNGQGFVTTGGYPQQPGTVYYGTAVGLQQPGTVYYGAAGQQQTAFVQATPPGLHGGQYAQLGAPPSYGYSQGQTQ